MMKNTLTLFVGMAAILLSGPSWGDEVSGNSWGQRYGNVLPYKSGHVVTWGPPQYGGDSSDVQAQLTNVKQVVPFGTMDFAALKTDGTVVLWGGAMTYFKKYAAEGWPGYNMRHLEALLARLTNVKALFQAREHLLALKEDGSVIIVGGYSSLDANGRYNCWSSRFEYCPPRGLEEQLVDITDIITSSDGLNGIGGHKRGLGGESQNAQVIVAVKKDGSAITWGPMTTDAKGQHFPELDPMPRYLANGTGIIQVLGGARHNQNGSPHPEKLSAITLKNDGTVDFWCANPECKGHFQFERTNVKRILDVGKLGNAPCTFEALNWDGTVVLVNVNQGFDRAETMFTGVKEVVYKSQAYTNELESPHHELSVAVKWDGTLAARYIGKDSQIDTTKLNTLTNVESVHCGNYRLTHCAALLRDGSVTRLQDVPWGAIPEGTKARHIFSGSSNYAVNGLVILQRDGTAMVLKSGHNGAPPTQLYGVVDIAANLYSYAALIVH